MVLEMSTEILPIVIPDTYGYEFQYEVAEDMWDKFKQLMVNKAWTYIMSALNETDFKDSYINMISFVSPREYNYRTDRIDFDLYFNSSLIKTIKNKVNDQFFEYIKRFGSYDGFISFYPTSKNEFYEALEGKRDDKLALAVSLYIMWQLKEQGFDIEEYQRDYLEDVEDYANGNGYFIDDEDE